MAKLLCDKCQLAPMANVSPPPEDFPVVRPEILIEGRLMDTAIHAAKRKNQRLPAIWLDISPGAPVDGMTSLSD
jgi:hypothetical protein